MPQGEDLTERHDLVEILSELVAADTVSSNGCRAAMERLGDRLADAGCEVAYQTWGEGAGAKANLVATLGPPEPDGLILSGHLDVVPFADQPGWTREPLTLGLEDARAFGRGTTDMKGFLAQCVVALADLDADRLRRPLGLVFTADEEVGCQGAARLAPVLAETFGRVPLPKLCWIGEPTSWEVFHTHKGVASFGVTVRGAGGHSSLPEAGVNAIAVAAQLMARIGEVQAELRGSPSAEWARVFPEAPYTTLNFGTVAGGSALNMIADECRFAVSYRPLPDEPTEALWTRLRDRLLDDPPVDWGSGRAAVAVEVGPPFSAPGLASPLGTPLEHALRERLGRTAVGGAPFCTDGGQLAAAGIDSIICGPGDLDQAHQPDESISRQALDEGVGHVRAVVEALCMGER